MYVLCMYVCMYVRTYLCMCVHVGLYLCIHVCMYVCLYVCIVCVYVCMFLCVCVCVNSLHYKHRQTNVCNITATQYTRGLTYCQNRIMCDVAKQM